MILILLGLPGSGKGTISSKLVNNRNFKHISSGDIFRALSKETTPLALKVKETIESGQLVDDELTWEVFSSKFDSMNLKKDNVIFDGYPRNIEQYKNMENFFKQNQIDSYYYVYFDVDQEVVLERLSGRQVCPNDNKVYHKVYNPSPKGDYCEDCGTKLITRKDDQVEAIQVRLDVYASTTKKMIDLMIKEDRKNFIKLNANKSALEANEELEGYVNF